MTAPPTPAGAPTWLDRLRPFAPLLAQLVAYLAARASVAVSADEQKQLVDLVLNVAAGLLATATLFKVLLNKRVNPANADSAHLAVEGKVAAETVRASAAQPPAPKPFDFAPVGPIAVSPSDLIGLITAVAARSREMTPAEAAEFAAINRKLMRPLGVPLKPLPEPHAPVPERGEGPESAEEMAAPAVRVPLTPRLEKLAADALVPAAAPRAKRERRKPAAPTIPAAPDGATVPDA